MWGNSRQDEGFVPYSVGSKPGFRGLPQAWMDESKGPGGLRADGGKCKCPRGLPRNASATLEDDECSEEVNAEGSEESDRWHDGQSIDRMTVRGCLRRSSPTYCVRE